MQLDSAIFYTNDLAKAVECYRWATNFSILDPDGNKIQFLQKQ